VSDLGRPLLHRLAARTARVCVLGQGYVGLAVAMRASEAGFPVVGYEPDPVRLDALRAGSSYVEDVSHDALREALVRGYRPTADLSEVAGFDVAVISVPTPLTEGAPDLSYIEDAAEMVGASLSEGALVILESTTYPGTTEEVVGPILEKVSGLRPGDDFLLGYSPERIDPGNSHFGLGTTPKIVSGVNAESLVAVEAFFGSFVDCLVPVARPAEAELAKLVENTFRHVNIALVNELAMFAADLEVDVWAAIDAAATKPFGFMPFHPGPGVGGHCLPIDPSYLSWRVRRRLGETFRFVELANEINARMPVYIVRRVQESLNREGLALKGSRILVLGLSYKPRTGDARQSPSIPIIEGLLKQGAEVAAADPHVGPLELDAAIQRVELDAAVLRWADLVLLVTDHPEFDYELVVREARRVFDTRNRLEGAGASHVERL